MINIPHFSILFWASVFGLFYISFGYPLVLCVVAKLRPRPVQKAAIVPMVSVIIAAYNEEDVIKGRIENCLSLDYPQDKLEILVASDGSTDRTNSIVAEFRDKRVRLIACSKRGGKLSAINRAVPEANGEILVFSDANSRFASDAVFYLVRSFNDSKVGCVAGRKVIHQAYQTDTSASEGFYWKYEHFLKEKETLIHSAMGADGSIYAIRKELYYPPEEKVGYADDGIISMSVIQKGYRLVYEAKAENYETASDSIGAEFRRKIRTLSGGLEWMATLRTLMIPFSSPVWWQLWSHRLLRFTVPYLLIVAFLTNALLAEKWSFYFWSFAIQCFVYLMGLGGMAGLRHKLCRVSFYLTLMNFVFVPALGRFLFGKTEVAWDKKGR